MTCGSCGAENDAGHRFCSQSGSPLGVSCPSCGTANEPGDRYCGSCGTALGAEAAAARRSAATPERRLVSILFADLVGFTTLSEHLDAEEVRELRTILGDLGAKLLLARAEQALASRPASAA